MSKVDELEKIKGTRFLRFAYVSMPMLPTLHINNLKLIITFRLLQFHGSKYSAGLKADIQARTVFIKQLTFVELASLVSIFLDFFSST